MYLVTFMAKGFILGRLICFQQDSPLRTAKELRTLQTAGAGVCWQWSVSSRSFPAVAAALCACLPFPSTAPSPQSISLSTSSCRSCYCRLLSFAHGAAVDSAQRSRRVGKSLILFMFKMSINIIGSWDTLKCLIWNVLRYLSFQVRGKKRPLKPMKFGFPINQSPNDFVQHRIALRLGPLVLVILLS